MANYNKVILIGNLTRDPQLRYTPSQAAVCDFGIAVNRQWTGQDGQPRKEVCFVDCTAWGRQAETVQKYMNKGRPIFIEGRLTWHQWDGPDGKKRSKLEVTVERFQFLGGRKDDAEAGGPRGGGGAGAPSRNAERQETSGQQEQKTPDYDFNQDVDEDTIPF